tara:strand:+ start:403 stop:933 length:531 start_codon:yes stop_codon:yes gene_type:complete
MSNNTHRYNNETSRWCDQNNVPYQRNGFLFGPTTVEDQVTNNTFHIIQGINELPEGVKADQIFNEGDWLIGEYQQGYIRCKVTGFSPRAGNLIVDRFYNDAWRQIIPDKHRSGFIHNIQNVRQNGSSWGYGTGRWLESSTKPVIDAQHSGHTVRTWAWFAVPKESVFKLNLLGVSV